MPPKIYKSEEEKKKAYALAKKLKRATDKLAKDKENATKSANQLISELVIKLVNDIPQKAEVIRERKRYKTKHQAVKRAAVKEAANIMPKRQKYAK